MKKTFQCNYHDPITQEHKSKVATFEETSEVSAEELAQDWGYTLADKPHYTLTLLKEDSE